MGSTKESQALIMRGFLVGAGPEVTVFSVAAFKAPSGSFYSLAMVIAGSGFLICASGLGSCMGAVFFPALAPWS